MSEKVDSSERTTVTTAKDMFEITKRYLAPSEDVKSKVYKILDRAELEAHKGSFICYIGLSEYDKDYQEVCKQLLRFGYKIYTGRAYQQYITWK